MTTTLESTVLTADHVKALRNSDDSIVFRYRQAGGPEGEVESWIDCNKKRKAGDGFDDGNRLTARVPTRARVTIFDKVAGNDHALYCDKADWVILSPSFSEQLQTIFSLLRAGDELHVRWLGGNNSPVMTEHTMLKDEIHLEIHREVKGQRRMKYAFYLDDVVVPIGSVARNVHTQRRYIES